jgi:hypothetical protein
MVARTTTSTPFSKENAMDAGCRKNSRLSAIKRFNIKNINCSIFLLE